MAMPEHLRQVVAAARPAPAPSSRPVPDFLRRTQAPARFAAWDDGCLEIRVGEEVLVLMPEDLRRLADFTRRWEGEAP